MIPFDDDEIIIFIAIMIFDTEVAAAHFGDKSCESAMYWKKYSHQIIGMIPMKEVGDFQEYHSDG